jgi:hypothetical protein
MKKIIITILFLMTVNYTYSQIKMDFYLANPRDSVGYFMYDLRVCVLSGQVWKVGSSNIRVSWAASGPGNLVVKADNPAINANPNISNANGYQAMTTTSIGNGDAIGLNILTFNTSGFFTLTTGIYRLATLRWTKTPPLSWISMVFRIPPTPFATIVYDSTVLLTYTIHYTATNPIVENAKELITELPKDYNLYQNYPNPFNPVTTIKFDIPKLSFVTLKVYDISGKEIEVLANHYIEGGTFVYNWDASKYASGIYFYRLETPEFVQTKKMILLK